MQKHFNTRFIARTAVIAAIYAALTVGLAPISYMALQFRISEILVLLAFINPAFAPGLVLGTFIANLFSPLGIIDVIFGTMATIMSIRYMILSKNIWIASLYPTIFNGIIIGAELHFVYSLPLALTMLQVAAGEFVVVTILGVPVMKALLKNKALKEKLEK
ncbi:MAG TPA: QueT transporter family protein [Clostridia bacterium]|nr:QueT transporter family protein [Clostridia bacterium]